MITTKKTIDENKPIILIGIIDNNMSNMHEYYKEVAYGIEEEGCLQKKYIAENFSDVFFSKAGVTLIISDHESAIFVSDIKLPKALLVIEKRSSRNYMRDLRCLGKNSARFFKGMPLENVFDEE